MLDLVKIFGISIYIVMIIVFTAIIIVANAEDIRKSKEGWKWVIASFFLGCVWPIVLCMMLAYFIHEYTRKD